MVCSINILPTLIMLLIFGVQSKKFLTFFKYEDQWHVDSSFSACIMSKFRAVQTGLDVVRDLIITSKRVTDAYSDYPIFVD